MEWLLRYELSLLFLIAMTISLATARNTRLVRNNWPGFVAAAAIGFLACIVSATGFAIVKTHAHVSSGPLYYMLMVPMLLPAFAFMAGAIIVTSPDVEIGNGAIAIRAGSLIYRLIKHVGQVDTKQSYNLCAMSWKVGAMSLLAVVCLIFVAILAVIATIGIPLVCGRNPFRVYRSESDLPTFCLTKVGALTIPLSPLLWGAILGLLYKVCTDEAWFNGTGHWMVALSVLGAIGFIGYVLVSLGKAGLVRMAQPADSGFKAAVCPAIVFIGEPEEPKDY
jgi:hypothetical protein